MDNNRTLALEHEFAFINAFIERDRRERWRMKLVKPKHRRALLHELSHYDWMDNRFMALVEPSKQHSEEIQKILETFGAPADCYVISEATELDGKFMPLAVELNEVVGSGMGSIVSCVPGKLGYYETDDIGCRYILRRPK